MPKVGQVFEKKGLRREVVSVVKRSDFKKDDYDVTWQRPGKDMRTWVLWLPYWKKWVKGAELVA